MESLREASIIAAGGSPLGFGSDSGGSIRQPEHCCGVAGLKPTSGRVPLTGHFPFICPTLDPRTVIGPLARHVDDLALALRTIAGVDWQDASVMPVPLTDTAEAQVSGMRVAFYLDHPGFRPDPDVVATTRAAARTLSDAGLRVEETSPPGEVERSLFEWDRFRRRMLPFIREYPLVLSPAAISPLFRMAKTLEASPTHLRGAWSATRQSWCGPARPSLGCRLAFRSRPRHGGKIWRWLPRPSSNAHSAVGSRQPCDWDDGTHRSAAQRGRAISRGPAQ